MRSLALTAALLLPPTSSKAIAASSATSASYLVLGGACDGDTGAFVLNR